MKPGSLVGRLVWLAAGWSLAVLFATGLALSAIFQQAAISRFDLGLTDVADALYAGSTVDQTGEVLAPALTDARALRAFSGKYWEIAESGPKGLRPIARSRSLWDSELAAPPANVEPPRPGAAIFYTGDLFPGWKGNLLMVGEADGRLHRLVLDRRRVAFEDWYWLKARLRDVAQAPDGSLYVVTDELKGQLLHITPAAAR